MATIPASPSAPPAQPSTGVEPAPPELSRFEKLMERIRGTVIIHGDIVSPDPELSPSQKLSERLRGTVIIHGDIVSPDPELWNSERGA